MVREFKLPDVGEGLTEAEIVTWLVEPGDTVTEDQPVAEVETDKAVVEVPAPVNGTVREILAEEGEMVPVGEVIITFDVEGEPAPADEEQTRAETEASETAEAVAEQATESAVEPIEAETEGDRAGGASRGGRTFAAPSARRLARELGVDITQVEGSGPGGRVTDHDVRSHAEGGRTERTDTHAEGYRTERAGAHAESGGTPEPEPAGGGEGSDVRSATRRVTDEQATATGAESESSAAATPVETAGRDRTLAAPATRRLADEEGVDLDDVPTDLEEDGEPFVTPEQVREYAEAQRAAQAADAEVVQAGREAAPEETGAAEADQREERIPYKGIRRTIGRAMERSKYTAPHVTHHDDVDVTRLVEVRDELKAEAEARGQKLTYLPFVVKAAISGLKEFPILNSQLDEENEEIVVKHYYNVGIATATDAGLMVPVVEDADRKGLLEIASEVRDLTAKARDRSITRAEMQGGTFSITNFGAIGGEYATPIINYPETAILGLGAIEEKPRVVDGEVVPREVLTLSLSIDHRVIDGAEAARFTNAVKRYLKNPELLLLE